MKLKIKLQYNDIKDDLYLTLFLIVPVLIIFNQTSFKKIIIPIIILMLFLLPIFKKQKKIIYLAILLIIIIIIPIIRNEINYRKNYNYFNNHKFNDECQIIDLVEYDNYQKITFKKNKIRFIGTLNNKKINSKLLIGMKVKLKGTLIYPNKYFTDPDFNYQDYLKKKQIVGNIEIEEITISNKNILFKNDSIKNINLLLNRFINKNHPYDSKQLIKNLVLGTNSINTDTKNNLNKLGISHLFVVSGMHFSVLILIFDKIFKLPFLKNIKHKKLIKIIYLSFYVIITKFTFSIIRCFLQNIIKLFNEQLNLNKFNQFTLSFLLAIIIQPFSIFSTSFHLTYIISGSIILLMEVFNKFKNEISKTILTTISLNLIILPFISKLNGYINLLISIFNLLYVPFITTIMFPFSFLVIALPFLNKLYYLIYQIFLKSINFFSNNEFINLFNITLPKTNSLFILIYYLILIIFFKMILMKKKKIKVCISLLIILMIWNNYSYFFSKSTCEFLNVKIGDITIINEKNLKKVILIDTGDDEEVITYLRKRGIKKIDLIIISHPDSDHFGNLTKIIKNFKVKKVIIGPYDTKTSLIVKKDKIKVLLPNELLKIGHITIKCLSPSKNYGNINDNSLVFILNIYNTSILFTGDITEKVEKELIKNYRIDVDLLKVAHHGSITSSSTEFLKNIQFKKAIAMNGYQNNYNFPNQEVIERFKFYSLINTKERGTIIINL